LSLQAAFHHIVAMRDCRQPSHKKRSFAQAGIAFVGWPWPANARTAGTAIRPIESAGFLA